MRPQQRKKAGDDTIALFTRISERFASIREELAAYRERRRARHAQLLSDVEQTQLIAVVVLMFIAKLFESSIPPALDLGIWIAFSIAVIFWAVRRIFRKAY